MDAEEKRSEAAIIRHAQCRDSDAFAVLYKRYYQRMYRTVYAMLGHEADAQDITQKVWLKAWDNLDQYNFTSALTTWLHRIAVNTALDHLRQRKRWHSRFRSFFGTSEGGGEFEVDPPAADADPALGLLGQEGACRVHKALARLPEAQRIVVVLKEFEDYTYQEIADTVGCKIGTVMSRLHLARQKLRTLLTTDEP